MRKRSQKTSYIIIIFISIVLFASVVALMKYVEGMLRSDVRISLTEIVNQNKNVITSKVTLELNNINMVAEQISSQIDQTNDASDENVRRLFLNYAQRAEGTALCWSNAAGEAIFGGGEEVNISGRKYFQLAMEGDANVSEQLISRLTGEDIFVMSVPLYYDNQIIGTIQRQYPPKEIYDICSLSLFSKKGSMYIINSEGYILISSDHDSYNEASNYYRMVYLSNADAAKDLENNIKDNKSGLIEIKLNKKDLFTAYTPVEEVHDWYLITSIENSAVIPNANSVIHLFYVVLCIVAASFAVILLYNMQLKRKQQQYLERLAFVDTVTGGDTYTKFTADWSRLLEESGSKKYAILVFDIDGFHYINRFYGFETGDNVLKEIYAICQEHLGETERIARVSADQFVVALENDNPSWLETVLCKGVKLGEINVYFSAGIYPVKDKSEGISLMIDKATLASAEAKGKRFKKIGVYSEEFDKRMTGNEQLKQEIDEALERSEFVPFFQPKVDIYTNELVGAEALARWIKEDGSVIPPSVFIPISEQTDMIRLIDWMIFEKTLQFLRENLDRGIPCVPISVNFSRSNLLDDGFLQKMRENLEKYQVPGEFVEVELTETTIFDNSEMINAFIAELHKLNLTVSMDDFGSGYSSLNMLKDVDIDVLKIDQAFLRSESGNDKQQVIFETIAQMAKKLKLQTVVEGVETPENVNSMRKTECAVAQGYFYSKPMRMEAFQHCYEEGRVLEK